jgi:hypothetical protein
VCAGNEDFLMAHLGKKSLSPQCHRFRESRRPPGDPQRRSSLYKYSIQRCLLLVLLLKFSLKIRDSVNHGAALEISLQKARKCSEIPSEVRALIRSNMLFCLRPEVVQYTKHKYGISVQNFNLQIPNSHAKLSTFCSYYNGPFELNCHVLDMHRAVVATEPAVHREHARNSGAFTNAH